MEGNKAPNQGKSAYCTVANLYRNLYGVSLPTTPWGGDEMYREYKPYMKPCTAGGVRLELPQA